MLSVLSWNLGVVRVPVGTRIATMCSESFLYYLLYPFSPLHMATPLIPSFLPPHSESSRNSGNFAYWDDGLARYKPQYVMENKEL